MISLASGPLLRIGAEGHQRALGAGTGDGGELVAGDAVAGHEHGAEPLIAHLPQHEAAGGVHAAPVEHLDAGVLQLGDERGEILLAGADAFVDHLGDAEIVHRLLGLVGEALAVRRLVVDDGDLLVLQIVGDVLAGDAALLIVAAAGAEHVPQLAFGDRRVGGRRRDHQHAVVDVDLRRRHGDAGIEVADDEVDALAEEIVGDRNALARDRRRRRRRTARSAGR